VGTKKADDKRNFGSGFASCHDPTDMQFTPSRKDFKMLAKLSDDGLRELPKYDRIAIYLFRKLTHGMTLDSLPDEIFFDLDDVRAAMRAAVKDGIIDNEVKNAADIKYTYDARRNLPAEME